MLSQGQEPAGVWGCVGVGLVVQVVREVDGIQDRVVGAGGVTVPEDDSEGSEDGAVGSVTGSVEDSVGGAGGSEDGSVGSVGGSVG